MANKRFYLKEITYFILPLLGIFRCIKSYYHCEKIIDTRSIFFKIKLVIMMMLKFYDDMKAKGMLFAFIVFIGLSSCKKEEATGPMGPLPAAVNGWHKANLTMYESFPTSDEECKKYNGCDYPGMFAFLDKPQTLEWVKSHNIISVYTDSTSKYALKTLRLRKNGKTFDAVVYDTCDDKDCNGCCTINAKKGGLNFLIDMEQYTVNRFGSFDGEDVVEWKCLNCK